MKPWYTSGEAFTEVASLTSWSWLHVSPTSRLSPRLSLRQLRNHSRACSLRLSSTANRGLFNGPVQWASRKQRHVGTSSIHNEVMALFHACVDTVWLRRLLKEAQLADHVIAAIITLGDND